MKALRRSLGLALSVLMFTSVAAQASFTPVKMKLTREQLADICEDFGPMGVSKGLINLTGDYSCENTSTGHVIECKADGNCTLYFTDPDLEKKISA